MLAFFVYFNKILGGLLLKLKCTDLVDIVDKICAVRPVLLCDGTCV